MPLSDEPGAWPLLDGDRLPGPLWLWVMSFIAKHTIPGGRVNLTRRVVQLSTVLLEGKYPT
jgi:hypothetical protein